jgi:hypothetical protein
MEVLKVLLVTILLLRCCISFIDIKSFVNAGSFPGTIFHCAISTKSADTLYVSLLENGKEVINKYSVISDTLVIKGQLII